MRESCKRPVDLGTRIADAQARAIRQQMRVRRLRSLGRDPYDALLVLDLMKDALSEMREVRSTLQKFGREL
jgi:sirohydrochlorin ferrochelatase